MARIQIDDLPLLQDLSEEELQGIFGEGIFPAERLRELAAAATLGVTLVSAPFATAGGKGGGQCGRPSSPGPSRSSAPSQTWHHTQPGHYQQASWQGGWQGGGWQGEVEGGYDYFAVEGF